MSTYTDPNDPRCKCTSDAHVTVCQCHRGIPQVGTANTDAREDGWASRTGGGGRLTVRHDGDRSARIHAEAMALVAKREGRAPAAPTRADVWTANMNEAFEATRDGRETPETASGDSWTRSQRAAFNAAKGR
jgi:hypothetical protein